MPILKEGAGLDFVLSGGELTVTVDPTEVASIMVEGEDAALLGSGAAADGYVLTADGAGGAAWEAAAGGTGAVDSVFGRTGIVVAEIGDYDAAEITNNSPVIGATVADALGNLNATKLQAQDDADLLGSGAATDGYVLTADGAGGAEWEPTPPSQGVVPVAANRTLQASDNGKTLRCTGTITITLPPSLATAFETTILNVGSGTVTLALGTGVTTVPTTLPSLDNTGDNELTIAHVQHAGGDVFDVVAPAPEPVTLGFALSDEDTDLAASTAVLSFRMPFPMELTGVRFTVNTAPTGSGIQFDINKGGVTILSTKATIDAGETSSATAATPPVISDSTFADNILTTIDIDSVGSTTPGKGAKLWLYGYRTG